MVCTGWQYSRILSLDSDAEDVMLRVTTFYAKWHKKHHCNLPITISGTVPKAAEKIGQPIVGSLLSFVRCHSTPA